MVVEMEKRKWLWKRKPSDKSPGETESSGSLSSYSERYSDEQDALKEFHDHRKQSPEVTSKAATIDEETNESLRCLTEKLSAALVNVSAKEDLVKQHAKVAEEAIAGWEKAESEVAVLKQQLDAAVQQNLMLEVRVSHLDGALKECVRQLRQARDEQEKIIQDALAEKNEWESEKTALEKQLLKLQIHVEAGKAEMPTSTDPDILVSLKCLEKENTALKSELHSCSEVLEIRTIERELSIQAAETASKQQLESIKKVTKLEAECRKLQAMARKSSPFNDQRSSAVSSFYVDSVTDSQSDSGERLNTVDNDALKMSRLETREYEPSCSNSWASALIAELDQFKNEKATPKTLAACSIEIDMMDDFLEMEQLAALSETANKTPSVISDAVPHDSPNVENPLAAEYDALSQRVVELEKKLEKIEAEKAELENALSKSQDALMVSSLQHKETQTRLEDLQKELDVVNESKELLEFQLYGMEVEARTMSVNIDSLKREVEKEKSLSSDKEARCRELENELRNRAQEVELQQTSGSNGELKIKQEDLAVAADKLAECQKTIASLGKQLQSLATLEDFLIDTANLPGGGSVVAKAGGELWKLHVNETFTPKRDSDPTKFEEENVSHSKNGNEGESPASSSSSSGTQFVKGSFGVFAVYGEEDGIPDKKSSWLTLFNVEDPRTKVPPSKGKFLDANQALEVARYDLQYCDWRARQDVLTIMLLHEKVVEVLNPLARDYKSIGTMKKELAELQEELSQAHNQVHISEARVSAALDKLAYMEELVNDRLLQERNTAESDCSSSSASTSTGLLDTVKSKQPRRTLNVSGPVQDYSSRLKNFWYPVAFSADLKDDTMLPIDCFEQPWVIFRGTDGKPGCVQNTCAHRACPLDLGSVNEGRIRCPYHGWEYSTDGKCEKMPSTRLLNVKIKALPCFEQEGMIWIWPGNDPPAATLPSLLPPSGFQIHAEIVMELPVEHGLLLDNLLDLAHAPFTHTSTFAKGWSVPSLVKFLTPASGLQGYWDPYPIDMEFRPPCMVLSTIGISKPGKLEGQTTKQCSTHLHQLHVCLPASRQKTRLLYRMSLDFAPLLKHIPFMQHVWRHFAEQVLNEDLRLVLGQQDRMLNGANIWNLPVAYDKLGVRYRIWRDAVDGGAMDLPFSK